MKDSQTIDHIHNLLTHIGNARKPCIKATIGDTTTVAGTDITPEVAIVCATTARAVTGQRRDTGHLVLKMVIVAVAPMAAITDMMGLVVTMFTATMHSRLLVSRRTVPAVELLGLDILADL